MNVEQLEQALVKYVPEPAIPQCVDWILQYRIAVRITRSRHTKYGDYRPPENGTGHRISVNHDLNKFAFLLTFTHEVAHLVAFSNYFRAIEPHGKEWKLEFKRLMEPFFSMNIFPDDLVNAIKKYMDNPAASSCSDLQLMRALSSYDKRSPEWKLLEEIEINTPFKIRSGRIFIKGKLLNKNYSCTCLKSRHIYTINPLTEVKPLTDPEIPLPGELSSN